MKEKGYNRLEKLMLDISTEYLPPIIKELEKDSSYDVHRNDLKYIVLSGFYEIRRIIETTDMIEILMKGDPPESVENKKTEYFSYLIQSHIQELYILKERLNSYITKIIRKYKKSYPEDIFPQGKDNIIYEVINTFLASTVKLRNKHVHSEKYIPDEINKIIGFDIASYKEIKFKIFAEQMYDFERNKWIDKLKKDRENIQIMLDAYFDYVYTIISINGEFKYPNEIELVKKTN